MALIERFKGIIQGGITLIGNTQVLNKSTPTSRGQDFTTSCYTSTNMGLQAFTLPNPAPFGTTLDPTQASSSAELNMPSGSTVLFAQLFWTTKNIYPNPDGPITLTFPNGGATPVTPDLALKQYGNFNDVIWQAKDVTSIINSQGTGTYIVSGLPGIILVPDSSDSPNAWGLIVAYQNNTMPYRYVNINTGFAYVTNGQPTPYNFGGFYTPSAQPIHGYFLSSNTYGDLEDSAVLNVGPNAASITTLGNPSVGIWNGVAPYASIDNIFPANILNADPNDPNIGMIQTNGWPSGNTKNPFNQTSPAFARNNFDILGINFSSTLTVNQNTLYTNIKFTGNGQAQVSSESVQIDLNSANLGDISKTVDKGFGSVNTTLTYTVSFSNQGLQEANNVILIDTLPNSVAFLAGSVAINGVTSVTANISPPGINLGTVTAGQRVTVTFDVRITALPTTNPISNVSELLYKFSPGPGLTIPSGIVSNPALTTVNIIGKLDAKKQVSSTTISVGGILTYTIPITNSGSVTANGIIFIDTLPFGTSLIDGSFNQDGVLIAGSPNPPGVLLNSINAGITSTVSFSVKVTSIPATCQINNSASMTFNYIVDPTGPVIEIGETNTNYVITTLNRICRYPKNFSYKEIKPYYSSYNCNCDFSVNVVGVCDLSSIDFTTLPNIAYKTDYNWTEISIPEVLLVPCKKPDIESIDKVLITVKILCAKLIETPKYLKINASVTPNIYELDANGFPIPLPNTEGTYLTGRKLLVEGVLKQKIIYTANVPDQSVHSVHFDVPFSSYIIVYPKFTNAVNNVATVDTAMVDLEQDFGVEACIEDVYIEALDERTIFKNVLLFLRAEPLYLC